MQRGRDRSRRASPSSNSASVRNAGGRSERPSRPTACSAGRYWNNEVEHGNDPMLASQFPNNPGLQPTKDPQFESQPIVQTYGGEVYIGYQLPSLLQAQSNIQLALGCSGAAGRHTSRFRSNTEAVRAILGVQKSPRFAPGLFLLCLWRGRKTEVAADHSVGSARLSPVTGTLREVLSSTLAHGSACVTRTSGST